MTLPTVTSPQGITFSYQGLGVEAGPLPAFFYFALSGEESLTLKPYNAPVATLEGKPLRVFSSTLPGHGPGFDKHRAIAYWAEQLLEGNYVLETFVDEVAKGIGWLIEEGWIDSEHLAVGGLSRGAWIALHVAAKEKRIQTLIGFAPVTSLGVLEDFQPHLSDARLSSHLERLEATALVEHLTHLRHMRLYMGALDTRVDTDACYQFIRQFAQKVEEKRARHCHFELLLSPSIGHKGHGTSDRIFDEGALWIKHHLLGGV